MYNKFLTNWQKFGSQNIGNFNLNSLYASSLGSENDALERILEVFQIESSQLSSKEGIQILGEVDVVLKACSQLTEDFIKLHLLSGSTLSEAVSALEQLHTDRRECFEEMAALFSGLGTNKLQ